MHIAAVLVQGLGLLGLASGRAVQNTPPTPQGHVVHEKRDIPHPRLTRRMEPDAVLPMRVGLRQNAEALARGEEWLMEVSHPRSPKYGRHWTQDEVIAAFRPSDETVDTVAAWLVKSGIAANRITHSDNKAWLAFDATVAEAEALLHTEYYREEDDGERDRALVAVRQQYHIPSSVRDHVDYITPGLKGAFMDLRAASDNTNKKRSAAALRHNLKSHTRDMPVLPKNWTTDDLSTCDKLITPACLRALYHFDAPSPNATVSANNSLGIFEEGDMYSQDDLDSFYANYTPDIPKGTGPVPNMIDGAEAPVKQVYESGVESTLDFELAIPIIYPQTTTLYQTDDAFYGAGGNASRKGFFNTFLDALDGSYCTYSAYGETGNDADLDPVYPDTEARSGGYTGPLMCGVYKPTNVISISYGVMEQDLPYYYQRRQCDEFMKLSLQGVSIFVASGDTGVGGYSFGTYGDLGEYGCLRDDDVFTPTQPNSCPWVTNVGATKVYPGKTVNDPESAVNDPESGYSSSGGFSNIFPIPAYQTGALATYFQDHNPPYPYYTDGNWKNATNKGVYNRNGRGIPDVAANGDNILIWNAGGSTLSGGTSASSPIFAGLVNRIVEERIKAGKGPLGFVNPVFYEHPDVLFDIKNGTNPGCGTDGFEAVEGWDPVTGLGTPNYPKMLELFLSLP